MYTFISWDNIATDGLWKKHCELISKQCEQNSSDKHVHDRIMCCLSSRIARGLNIP